MDVKELYLKALSVPIWIKMVIGTLLLVFWLLGQLAFKNSMVKIQESGAYASVSAIVVQSKEVQEVVGNDIAMSLVIADPKKGFFIAKVTGSNGYSFIKASFVGKSVNSIYLKVKDSGASPVPEVVRGDWVLLKI